MGEVSLGTLYDINKNLMKKEKKLSYPALTNKLKQVTKFFKNNKMYFMLLCNEAKDYTIFKINNHASAEKAAEELKECLLNRGEVLDISKVDEIQEAFEIWIKMNNDAYCYYLFPYDEAIIEV
jgi:hypothetical protein